MLYVAKFKHTKGRYLVMHECPEDGCGFKLSPSYHAHVPYHCSFGGQRILDRRQLNHGNPPDPSSGLWLDEMYRSFSGWEVESIKPHVKKEQR